MKTINWKALVALVVIIGVAFWAVDSVRTRSYSGSDLNFGVGSGQVTVTNASNEPVPVQLMGTGTRTFSISNTIEGVTGSSTRSGTGRNTTQLFEFELPPGVSEFTVGRGTDVNFVANTDTNLEATVQPFDESTSRNNVIVAVVVILGALFYISHLNGHRWISASRRKDASDRAASKLAERLTFRRMFAQETVEKPESS
jgi:hypothetical protein